MFKAIKEFFLGKPPVEVKAEAPYKVEAVVTEPPVATVVVVEGAGKVEVPAAKPAKAKKAPAAKKPATAKKPAAKPATAKKAPAKKKPATK